MFNNYEERGEEFRKLVRRHVVKKTEDRRQKTE
jgi:hypothetical protein